MVGALVQATLVTVALCPSMTCATCMVAGSTATTSVLQAKASSPAGEDQSTAPRLDGWQAPVTVRRTTGETRRAPGGDCAAAAAAGADEEEEVDMASTFSALSAGERPS